MNRRAFLATVGVIPLAGCSNLPIQMGAKDIGETIKFGEIEVRATDAMTTEKLTAEGVQMEPPSNGILALFKLKVTNTDITEHDIPVVNFENYNTLVQEEDTIHLAGINDVRIYGSDDGGAPPKAIGTGGEFGPGIISARNIKSLSVVGNQLKPYPTGIYRPSLEANSTLEGWTFAVIKKDTTPKLKIQFKDESAIWTAKSANLTTPEPKQVIKV